MLSKGKRKRKVNEYKYKYLTGKIGNLISKGTYLQNSDALRWKCKQFHGKMIFFEK